MKTTGLPLALPIGAQEKENVAAGGIDPLVMVGRERAIVALVVVMEMLMQ